MCIRDSTITHTTITHNNNNLKNKNQWEAITTTNQHTGTPQDSKLERLMIGTLRIPKHVPNRGIKHLEVKNL